MTQVYTCIDYCSREPRLSSRYPHGCSEQSTTPISGTMVHSSGLCSYCMHIEHMHAYKIPQHKIKLYKYLKHTHGGGGVWKGDSIEKHLLLFHRSHVQSLAPTSGGLKLSVTPAPGVQRLPSTQAPVLSCAYPHVDTYLHIVKDNKNTS